MIRLRRVTKIYKGNVYALEDATVDIERGEFAFLVGPSGSGKTTFIKLLIKEEEPTSGQIYIADTNINQMRKWKVPYLRRKIGCVFQDFKLLPHKTVFQNVAYAMEVTGKSRRITDQQVPEVLKLVGLGHKLDAFPDELSGGEQQRVAIARAFINRPPILLADEPTGNVDPSLGEGIVRLLEKINSSGTTVIMSTHDRSIVNTFRKRVIAMENGRIIRDQDRGVYGYE
ncbi:MAG: cell division ATP-binding protein FtsE [Candidatus Solincola sediminis]|uniref:Cell division ATP-binding protein FtsE n=1 Tax=Candidatus Solincola sediminis TaxID=1797199 RepID=A0A1F2WPH6_9ACTN|nr:MAG: cell division ATP-binding protein FtsE [Candidatus Solincola sediminis]OFW58746.1 MAG: cell division ATP-binding protein FtsE [Candidatus Solincola sediminis]